MLLHRYKEQDKPSKYLIFCSWPGFSCFFPYVDEYWSIQNDCKKIYENSTGFYNKNELICQYYRNLNQYFEDVTNLDSQFAVYYNRGLTNDFWNKYKRSKLFLPAIVSSAYLNKDFTREFVEKNGYKVLVYPSMYINSWNNNQSNIRSISKDFWSHLIKKLISENFVPVVCKSFLTYDLSGEFNQSCIYFSETDINKVLTIMRMSGCVLDIFTGISRYALAARAPFVCVDERAKYVGLKEYEIDDLCGLNLPKKYIFSFSTIIDGGTAPSWDADILNLVVMKLKIFYQELIEILCHLQDNF